VDGSSGKYVASNPEELRTHFNRVRAAARAAGDDEATAQWKVDLACYEQMRRYAEERAHTRTQASAARSYLARRDGIDTAALQKLDEERAVESQEIVEEQIDWYRTSRRFIRRARILFWVRWLGALPQRVGRSLDKPWLRLTAFALLGAGGVCWFIILLLAAERWPLGIWLLASLPLLLVCYALTEEADKRNGIRPIEIVDFASFGKFASRGITNLARAALPIVLTGIALLGGMALTYGLVRMLPVETLQSLSLAWPTFVDWLFPQSHGEIEKQPLEVWGAMTVACGSCTILVLGSWWFWLQYATGGSSVNAGLSVGRLVGGAAEGAMRGRALVIGLWWVAVGSYVLWVIWQSHFLDSFPNESQTLLRIIGTALGAYWLLGRGLGPIRSAIAWSTLSTESHGRARIATRRELSKAGLMFSRQGIYLGSYLEEGAKERERVTYPGRVNLITIGPAGSGKGTGLIIPNLSTLWRSIFIIDPKGEAAAVTARKRATFGPVIVINPFGVLVGDHPHLKSAGFNPLAELEIGDDFTDDCASIANALVREQGGNEGVFFTGSARDLLTSLIMYEKITNTDKANLANVRKLLTEPWGNDPESGPTGLALTTQRMAESDYEPLRSKSGRFKIGTKTTLDIISTAANETQFLDSPAMQRDLQGTSIDWASMKHSITTVYLILPADRLETHGNYLRLVVTSALRTLLRSPPSPKLPPVLFMLDEFAQLGYLPVIENAMAIARGFGVALWPFLQDLNQLNALYKDRWQTFIGNAEVLTAFAPRDVFTAQYLSSRCGSKTIIVESENERIGTASSGLGRGPQGVPLLRPEDLMAMPARQMLCFVEPVKAPFFTKAATYSDDDLFRDDLDPNPYHPA
jgi:type IV secretion system protein VirD4